MAKITHFVRPLTEVKGIYFKEGQFVGMREHILMFRLEIDEKSDSLSIVSYSKWLYSKKIEDHFYSFESHGFDRLFMRRLDCAKDTLWFVGIKETDLVKVSSS